MTTNAYHDLVAIFRRVLIIRSVSSLLRWDSAVMMPKKSERLRAEQLGTLHELSQSLLVSAKMNSLLAKARANHHLLDAIQQRNLALMAHSCQRLSAQPAKLFFKLNHAIQQASLAWTEARIKGNYQLFAPAFGQLITLIKEKGRRLADKLQVSRYEALMDEYDPGRKQADLDALFAKLMPSFPLLINQIRECHPTVKAHNQEKWDKRSQMAMCHTLLKRLHFPFQQGRLDESAHPFTEGTQEDIRITTIVDRNNPLNTVMGLMHELGHALYDSALPKDYAYQLVGQDAGMVIHEGVALFWEKMLGTSRPFTEWLGKQLIAHHPQSDLDGAHVYQKLNEINPDKIRIEADEVCYLPHIIIRYEVEKALINDNLSVSELPDFWQGQVKRTLGVHKTNPALDCLQDIHWAEGYFGYFHTYGLGFIFAAQLYEQLRQTHPQYIENLANGDFLPLLDWLKQSLFCLGNRQTSDQLIDSITHRHGLNWQKTLDYFHHKYFQAPPAN